MPRFPSREWVEAAIGILDEDPELKLAGEGWEGDFGFVVDAEPGALEIPFVVHVVPENGRLRRFALYDDPDELDVISPAYFARAKYSVWKGLLTGTADPIELLLRRKIVVRGDLQQVAERARFKGIGHRLRERLTTTFPDDRAG